MIAKVPEIRISQAQLQPEPSPPGGQRGAEAPPAYLRSSTRSDGGYDNPHRRPDHLSPQELLPDGAIGARFYSPDDAEALLRDRLAEIRRARGRG